MCMPSQPGTHQGVATPTPPVVFALSIAIAVRKAAALLVPASGARLDSFERHELVHSLW